jgi:predicted nucleic-acid-binding protein
VLVRLLIADDVSQTRRAQRLVAESLRDGDAVLVSLLTLIETEWVLRSRYELDKDATLAALRRLLETRELTIEDEPAVEEALFHWQDGTCGFGDCLIAAHNRRLGCRATATFDARAARAPGFVAV